MNNVHKNGMLKMDKRDTIKKWRVVSPSKGLFSFARMGVNECNKVHESSRETRLRAFFPFGIRGLSLNLQYDCCCPSPTSAGACRVRAGTFFAWHCSPASGASLPASGLAGRADEISMGTDYKSELCVGFCLLVAYWQIKIGWKPRG